jgi:hypothetical protein
VTTLVQVDAPLLSLRLFYGPLRWFNINFYIKPTKRTIKLNEAEEKNAALHPIFQVDGIRFPYEQYDIRKPG